MAEKRTTYKIQDLGGIGEVQIADEVVAIIAGLAATEVDGVASMAGNITNELVSKLGMKNLSKGVKVTVLEGVVTVDLNLNILDKLVNNKLNKLKNNLILLHNLVNK